jgi:hypothetical protein
MKKYVLALLVLGGVWNVSFTYQLAVKRGSGEVITTLEVPIVKDPEYYEKNFIDYIICPTFDINENEMNSLPNYRFILGGKILCFNQKELLSFDLGNISFLFSDSMKIQCLHLVVEPS